MSVVYDDLQAVPAELRHAIHQLLLRALKQESLQQSQEILKSGIRQLQKNFDPAITQDLLIRIYRADAGQYGLPAETPATLRKIRLKPMRSQSGIQSVAVLTKPFPCPGQCIFCPNDVRMPKSYIASEPGAQRAERNSFDPYLQTYNRLQALYNMGHDPSKIELIILGGTWSDYPEPYQIWFIAECFRALNDFGAGRDIRDEILEAIKKTAKTIHRAQNRVINSDDIAIDGRELNTKENYNQVVAKHYLLPERLMQSTDIARPEVATWDELEMLHRENENAPVRCVGLTIETRPDNISEKEVLRIRRLGATKTQIGFQSLNDEVLEKNKRGHDVAATRRAVAMLRQAGFKIHAHWMPNLYGSNPEMDREEYGVLFSDPDFKPDELKIYPCALIPSAELMQYHERGEWYSYSEETLNELLAYCLTHTPEWARLTRVVRDIPSTETVDTHIKTNQRQLVQNALQKQGSADKMQDIRAREIRRQTPTEPITLKVTEYDTAVSKEHFIQFVDAQNRILGFCRLSLPTTSNTFAELQDAAIIRELHVYGLTEKVGQSGHSQAQHLGLGKQLLEKAESIARAANFERIAVISAIGTRGYYAKRGYSLRELYQHKNLTT
ncbi:tRNA uridine(34) 5-carboxymethylaminomethyl modification radical SAM/GNAT enzyme Elp3 [Candidatus Woesebacteria bacterium]|nr:tRNA uridine(34) 5-carboxymethylaminomethyl modification radical SAM/GNAT enzyme Elp3 [Candidatus Woesebacteria bacterium]MCD8527637.1 tRNA uridine(34) 5-carboxymethylaminomethyl modification radical SAM/GNAT enzyme Elp3 [Candidatus Woesebacteria bacterium]MCD8546392.1 tRNA uridine(34) 5-carboxymethylaminomethyl modification radical SAM/GNAT enzyme Elp3 [Candidatus Woesebacteria bacterium]